MKKLLLQGGLNRQSSHDSQHSQGRSSISTRPAFLLDMPLATALPAHTEVCAASQGFLSALLQHKPKQSLRVFSPP